ncbi:ATP-dependent DNA helicase DinG [Metasolibacillus sp.]|uniref:ATP-dependent DNA helicase DinG n=1 Tax=Metasolibacillus sp. TaxID=2703680 RepID=UPI0025D7E034|nr:ATP-dependent DNA helicase DinG [Metasolibacillus sp.]MCT6923052.1 ATP-dependent DNA helicase DinG [Metasolibacillus sp.]MCT6939290.1 ATP-dependent DNA helicase DinG [Metasolibacillus sp.]
MMESQKYAIVDLETTGHSFAGGDRIIQIAIVIMKDWYIERTFTTFIHPEKSIPLFIQGLTNITDEDVASAKPFAAYGQTIYDLLQDAVFVAHNADFDLAFLQAELRKAGLPAWQGKKLDTVELAKIVFPMALSYKLGDLAQELHIPLEQAHRADDDAKATAQLLKACWEELKALPQATIEQLHKRSFQLKSDISHLLFAALHLKRSTVKEQQGFIYAYQLAIKQPPAIQSKTVTDSIYPKTRKEKLALLQKEIPAFEERPQQFQMMDIIWHSFHDKQEAMIEASTGIGKTLAYLLPAFYYAKHSGKKIGISTYTSNLLDQLLYEELVKLEQITGERVRVAVLKGMQNYIDIGRFAKILKVDDESYDETLAIAQVITWLAKTETGDLNELNMSGGGQLFLEKIRKLKWQKVQQFDFYSYAIEQSQHADILMTNHAMLLADLVRQEQLFDNVGGWIIDEAHQFIQAAVQQDEKVFSYTAWKYLFGRIGTPGEDQLFDKLQHIAMATGRVPRQLLKKTAQNFQRLVTAFDYVMHTLIEQLQHILRQSHRHEAKQAVMLTELTIDVQRCTQLSTFMQNWIDSAEQVLYMFYEHQEEISIAQQYILDEWQYWIHEFKIKVAEWDELFVLRQADYFAWFELDKRSIPGSLQLLKKPLQVTASIERLFVPMRQQAAIVWTSGTLTVPNNERFIADQLGIAADVPIHRLQASSSYYQGARCFIVTDMPDIQAVSQHDYIEEMAYAITRIVRTTEGRCFVLFTSQDMLRKTVLLIQETKLLDDYMLFAQGVTAGSRMRLLKSFQKFSHSVLFGTNSFWEGVDVPGDGLAAVIVVRLPFSAPNEPTFKAKSQMLQAQGHNAFTELALPEATLRFKQGFGRLIRSSTDSGAFIILDRRIDTKSYGKEFLSALPPISIQKLSLEHMVQALGNWYNNRHE